MSHTGVAIALAWPQTLCKHAGAWYDHPMRWLGFCSGGYYRVGHAAVVLVEIATGTCRYFDFGRYHAPAGYGRVRDADTDHDLRIRSRAHLDASGNILNLESVLAELHRNPACHGTGSLYGSSCTIDYDAAFAAAKQMQVQSPWPYGPFVWRGTNCSRFVRTVVLAGNPKWRAQAALAMPLTISPTPIWNVRAVGPKFITTDACQNSFTTA